MFLGCRQVLNHLKRMSHELFETQSQLVALGHTQRGGPAEADLTATLTDLYMECQHAATMHKAATAATGLSSTPP